MKIKHTFMEMFKTKDDVFYYEKAKRLLNDNDVAMQYQGLLCLKKTLELYPKYKKTGEAFMYAQLMFTDTSEESRKSIINLLTEALKHDPDCADYYYYRAKCLNNEFGELWKVPDRKSISGLPDISILDRVVSDITKAIDLRPKTLFDHQGVKMFFGMDLSNVMAELYQMRANAHVYYYHRYKEDFSEKIPIYRQAIEDLTQAITHSIDSDMMGGDPRGQMYFMRAECHLELVKKRKFSWENNEFSESDKVNLQRALDDFLVAKDKLSSYFPNRCYENASICYACLGMHQKAYDIFMDGIDKGELKLDDFRLEGLKERIDK